MAEVTPTATDVQPNMTIYINNLNEKIKLDELKKSLLAVFSQFGKILEVLAFKTLKHKGQAWVVFEEVSSATNARSQMQGFPFYDKPMRIQYAKSKSDIVAKADGTFMPREKRRKHDDRGRKKKDQTDANQASMGLNPAYAGAYGAAPPLSQIPFAGARAVPEAPAPPNNILFVQNLPHQTTSMMLQMLFTQAQGFKEVRMIEAKPGIAFVEYENEMQSTLAMQGLQGFKITEDNPMLITYAKKLMLERMAREVGNFIQADPKITGLWRDCMWVRVSLDVRSPDKKEDEVEENAGKNGAGYIQHVLQ